MRIPKRALMLIAAAVGLVLSTLVALNMLALLIARLILHVIGM